MEHEKQNISAEMLEKSALRREINDFCLSHVFKDDTQKAGVGEIPVAIVIYLGGKSENELSSLMDDGFASMLNVKPVVGTLTLDGTNIARPDYLRDEILGMIRLFNARGCFISDQQISVPIAFAAVMDDPFLASEEALTGISRIYSAIEELRASQMLGLGMISFYGFFDQEKTAKVCDYSNAFRLVSAGNSRETPVWNAVFHLQKNIIQQSYEESCRAAAMQILYTALFSGPRKNVTDREDDYSWYYLGLDEMNLPEQLLCAILYHSYGQHVSSDPLTDEERELFRRNLVRGFSEYIDAHCEVFRVPDCVTYLPMHFIPPREAPQKRSFFRRRENTEQEYGLLPSQMLLDPDEIRLILRENSSQTVLDLKKEEVLLEIFRKAVCDMGRVQTMDVEMSYLLMNEAAILCNTLEGRLQRFRAGCDSSEEALYFNTIFGQYVTARRWEIMTEVLSSIRGNEKFRVGLQKMVSSLKAENNRVQQMLSELRINAYGGAPAIQMSLPAQAMNIVTPLGATVTEACRAIPQDILNILVSDEELFRVYASDFINQAEKRSELRRTIGRVTGDHPMEDLPTVLLSARKLEFPGMIVQNSRFLRANTLQVITMCRWDSKKNLVQYCGAGDP